MSGAVVNCTSEKAPCVLLSDQLIANLLYVLILVSQRSFHTLSLCWGEHLTTLPPKRTILMALFTRVTPIGRKARITSYHIYEFSRVGVYFPWGYSTLLGTRIILGNKVFQASRIFQLALLLYPTLNVILGAHCSKRVYGIKQPYCKYFKVVLIILMH